MATRLEKLTAEGLQGSAAMISHSVRTSTGVVMHGSFEIVRRGRKRIQGERDNAGRLIRKIDGKALAALQPGRRELPEPVRLSEKAVSALGRYNLTGWINDEEHEAGRLYAVDCGAYFASIGVPTGMAGGGRGYNCKGEINCENCECRKRKDRYDDAFAALWDSGQRCAKVVAHVAVHGQRMEHGEASLLTRGLRALIKHYGLTARGKSPNRNNTN